MSAESPPPASATASAASTGGHGFGTAPVFLAAISTILGAIMFLRFGYAVGHAGFAGAILVILMGHLVTIPTALAISEIATNRRVEGGGEYFIISRSFGLTIGGTIGFSLYLSQAISVAFYMIAFAEAFRPIAPWLEEMVGLVAPGAAFDPRWISIPGLVFLGVLVAVKGADLGVQALWVVVSILGLSLVLFFMGSPLDPSEGTELLPRDSAGVLLPFEGDPLILVFAIVFPAFTGMTAGVGLSGDLANPRRSIPLGTMAGTLFGLLVYIAIVWKLDASATREQLASDPLIMAKIALWGPMILIGLGAATVSSAIGSILVAPRTLQALAADRILPLPRINRFLERGSGPGNDPRAATILTTLMAIGIAVMGDVDFVARIISMFFMVTYGSLCAISFLEHFAARPSYRPSFRSKWYLSLLGAVLCVLLMFQMDPAYALVAVVVMVLLYVGIRRSRGTGGDDLAAIFHGVMTQATRWMQVKMQKSTRGHGNGDWRPSVVMVSTRAMRRNAPLRLLGWLSHRYGFATYLHLIPGKIDEENWLQSRKAMPMLIDAAAKTGGAIYVDTLVSPSLTSALAQTLQTPGVSGMENNAVLFEFSASDSDEAVEETLAGLRLARTCRMSGLVLRHGERFFGKRSQIHVWLTWHDYLNANLMILLSYILLGHPDWKKAEIRVFAAFPHEDVEAQTAKLTTMIADGRISISRQNVRIIATDARSDFSKLVEENSADADLVVLGFTPTRIDEKGAELFRRHPGLGDVLFVCAEQHVAIE